MDMHSDIIIFAFYCYTGDWFRDDREKRQASRLGYVLLLQCMVAAEMTTTYMEDAPIFLAS